MRVAIVGGGIAGLAAAWELRQRAEVTVFEPERLGGRILTEEFEGRPVDCAADAFLTRHPAATGLCAELGIEDLVAPAAGQAMIWWNGRLEPIPEGVALGAPTRLAPLLRSRLLSPLGVLRAAGDVILPARPIQGDISVRALLAGRFGTEVADRLADPLIGSIHAGRSDELSAEATVPNLYLAASESRSLLLALRASARRAPAAAGPVFLTPRLGMQVLTDTLVARLGDFGVKVEALRVDALEDDGANGVGVAGERFDACVLAVGASAAARLLRTDSLPMLGPVPTASVALVTMGFPKVEVPVGVSGLLAPRQEGHLMTACSFSSEKWPHWSGPDRSVFRVSTGRIGDTRIDAIDDPGLVDRLAAELSRALRQPAVGAPETWRVSRWPDSFPQYLVGHARRVAALKDHLRTVRRNVALCGSSYEGVGIPACIASGRSAAQRLFL